MVTKLIPYVGNHKKRHTCYFAPQTVDRLVVPNEKHVWIAYD